MDMDDQIKSMTTDELRSDYRVEADDVSVDVADGVVTLRGTVPEYRALSAATMAAWAVEGVTEVNNELTVEVPDAVKLAADDERLAAELREKVTHHLGLDGDGSSAHVDVSVDDGQVVFRGNVDEYWKLQRLDDITEHTLGVVDLESYVTVVPTHKEEDKDIATRIQEALERSVYVDADMVTIQVEDGAVHLSGDVVTYYGRDRAVAAAGSVAGVTDIRNELRVTGPLNL